MQDKKNAHTLTAGEQTILDHITKERINADNHVNDLITEVKNEIAEVNGKTEALQKGVSNLQSVKKDMRGIKKDIEQIKEDLKTITSDYGYENERDENGKLKLA